MCGLRPRLSRSLSVTVEQVTSSDFRCILCGDSHTSRCFVSRYDLSRNLNHRLCDFLPQGRSVCIFCLDYQSIFLLECSCLRSISRLEGDFRSRNAMFSASKVQPDANPRFPPHYCLIRREAILLAYHVIMFPRLSLELYTPFKSHVHIKRVSRFMSLYREASAQ